MSASLGIGGASGILSSLIGSGLIPKEYKQLTSGSSYAFEGGGVAIIKSTGFSIIELGEAVNVSSEIFKDFSRGYAYGFATAASNQIDSITGQTLASLNGRINSITEYTGSIGSGGIYNIGDGNNRTIRLFPAQKLNFTYKSGTSGADKEVAKFEYYTIPFEEKIKLQSNVNYTYIMIYASE